MLWLFVCVCVHRNAFESSLNDCTANSLWVLHSWIHWNRGNFVHSRSIVAVVKALGCSWDRVCRGRNYFIRSAKILRGGRNQTISWACKDFKIKGKISGSEHYGDKEGRNASNKYFKLTELFQWGGELFAIAVGRRWAQVFRAPSRWATQTTCTQDTWGTTPCPTHSKNAWSLPYLTPQQRFSLSSWE